jgi:serine/threonine-protein kinase
LARIGHGSTGVVLTARDATTGAVVAIKLLARELCESDEFLVRYRGEVAMLDLIEHPNIAHVYELVERRGLVALVTELVPGPSLRLVLGQLGRLEPEASLYVAAAILVGLAEVHHRGIQHRAVKPESFLATADGGVKMVDIGVAGAGRKSVPTNPIYAAPELWSGGDPSVRSDLYAASAILFECLTGQPPRGTGGAALGRSGQDPQVAMSAVPPDVPVALRTFLTNGLAVDPFARPDDASAYLEQLELTAMRAFGRSWFETGQRQLQRRIAQVRLPALEPLPAVYSPVSPGAPAPPGPMRGPADAPIPAPRRTPQPPGFSPAAGVPAAGPGGRPTSELPKTPAATRPASPRSLSEFLSTDDTANLKELIAPSAIGVGEDGPPPEPDRGSRRVLRAFLAALAFIVIGAGTAVAVAFVVREQQGSVGVNNTQTLEWPTPSTSDTPTLLTTTEASPSPTPTGPYVRAATISWVSSACQLQLKVKLEATGPMTASVAYSVNGVQKKPKSVSFTGSSLTKTIVLETVDAKGKAGEVTVSVGDIETSQSWDACTLPTSQPTATETSAAAAT